MTDPRGTISMSTNLKTTRYRFKSWAEKKAARRQKIVRTTLGDLIAAVTDEVKPFVRDSSGRYAVVSYILNDLLARRRQRTHDRSLRKYSSPFAQQRYGVS
jgi:hypothetical protein